MALIRFGLLWFLLIAVLAAWGVARAEPLSGLVWSAGMETGDLSEWSAGGMSGASWDSGDCSRPPNGVSESVAHAGSYSMAMTIDTSAGPSGCRQARFRESKTGEPLYYGAWFYLPSYTKAVNYWNVVQFKSKKEDTAHSNVFWVLDVMPRPGRTLALRLRWKGMVRGPFAGDGRARRTWMPQVAVRVPVRRWFHVEVYFRPSRDYDGQVTVWQDDVLLWDFDRVKTRYGGGDVRWSVNNYSDRLVPHRATVHVDDATVATCRMGTSSNAIRDCAG